MFRLQIPLVLQQFNPRYRQVQTCFASKPKPPIKKIPKKQKKFFFLTFLINSRQSFEIFDPNHFHDNCKRLTRNQLHNRIAVNQIRKKEKNMNCYKGYHLAPKTPLLKSWLKSDMETYTRGLRREKIPPMPRLLLSMICTHLSLVATILILFI